MDAMLRNRFVDSRYALKEELDEVKEDVKIIKRDTVELKSVMNLIKWLVMATVPITAIFTSLAEEFRQELKGPMPQQTIERKKDTGFQIIKIGGQNYIIQSDGTLIPIK